MFIGNSCMCIRRLQVGLRPVPVEGGIVMYVLVVLFVCISRSCV